MWELLDADGPRLTDTVYEQLKLLGEDGGMKFKGAAAAGAGFICANTCEDFRKAALTVGSMVASFGRSVDGICISS